MITTYFILNPTTNALHSKQFYVKITAENEQICKDVFNEIYPQGYSESYFNEDFKLNCRAALKTTISQTIR